MIEILLILLVSIVLVFLFGLYLVWVMCGVLMCGDVVFVWVEKLLYWLFGVNFVCGMFWCGYVGVFLLSNVVIVVLV